MYKELFKQIGLLIFELIKLTGLLTVLVFLIHRLITCIVE